MSNDYTLPPVPADCDGWSVPAQSAMRTYGHACAEHARAQLAEENARLLARIAELEAEAERERLAQLACDAESSCFDVEFNHLQDENGRLSVECDRLRAEVEDWRKLLDPVNLHVNLLQGKPAHLTKTQLAHLLGQDYTALLAEVEALRECLAGAAKTRAPKPRTLAQVGTGALHGEQQYCFEKGYREGAAAVRKAIASKISAVATQPKTPWINPLAAEVEALQSANASLSACCEAMRADAERYQYLRDQCRNTDPDRMYFSVSRNIGHDWFCVDSLDDEIDAARKGEGSELAAQAKEGAE